MAEENIREAAAQVIKIMQLQNNCADNLKEILDIGSEVSGVNEAATVRGVSNLFEELIKVAMDRHPQSFSLHRALSKISLELQKLPEYFSLGKN